MYLLRSAGVKTNLLDDDEERFADFDLDSVPVRTPGRASVKKKNKRRSVCASDLPRDDQPRSPTGTKQFINGKIISYL